MAAHPGREIAPLPPLWRRGGKESCNRFPGFSYEVQGVYQVVEDDRIRFYTYVVKRWVAGLPNRSEAATRGLTVVGNIERTIPITQ